MEKTEKRKIIIHTLLIAVAIVAIVLLLRMLYQDVFAFNMNTVKTYVATASKSYTDPVAAAVIINQQIKAILDSNDEIQAVKFGAIQNGVSGEQQLVNSAVAMATTYGYL